MFSFSWYQCVLMNIILGQIGGWGDQTDYGFKKALIGYLQLQKLSSQNYLYLLSKKL